MQIAEINLKSGDCLLTTGEAFMSKAIRFMTSMQTKNAWASHVAGILSNHFCIEATYKTKINEMSVRYHNAERKIKIYRIPLTEEQRFDFKRGAYKLANKAYGWTKLPLFALDALTTKIFSFFGRKKPIFFFTRRFGIFNIPVCSQLYVYILHKFCGYHLKDVEGKDVSWRIVQPDYLDDLMQLPDNKAEVLFSQNTS